MTGKSPDDHRPGRWRKLRSIAVLTAASLAAPLGFVATTASPASAAPADGLPLVVTGDAGSRNTLGPGMWTWGGTDFNELKTLVGSMNVGGVTFDTTSVPSLATLSYPGTLSNVDVYFAGAVGGGQNGDTQFGYSAAEEAALQAWIRDGGVLIANTNNRDFDVTRFLGNDPNYRENYTTGSFVEVRNPRAFFEGAHDCNANLATNPGGSCPAPEAAPRPATVVSTGIGNGVGSIRNWHTVTAFDESTLPTGAQVIARLTLTCTTTQASCAEQAPDPLPAPPAPAWTQSYNNNLGTNVPVVAYVPFGANTALFGSGAVVMTSDVDTFSNAYPGGLTGGNRTLAQNIFRTIAEHNADLVAQPPPPPPPGNGGGGLGPNQCRAATNPAANPSASSAQGYWFLGRNGDVYNFGNASDFGGLPDLGVSTPAAAMSARADGTGYWVVDQAGIVHGFGNSQFHGDMRGIRLNSPIIALEPTPSGNGYWLLAGDGGVFSFGDATFLGSTGNIRLNSPIISMRAHPSGQGYWLLASDGGVFSFGNATFHGSTGNMKLNAPVLSMAVHPTGNGYWLLGGDGGVFSFGAVEFEGSVPGLGLCGNPTAVQIRSTTTGSGYYLLGGDGGVFTFGDAFFFGSNPGLTGANAAIDLVVRA